MASRYDETYQRWRENPEAFWADAATDITWFKPWDKVFDDTNPPFYRWFTGGETNASYNCLDVHVAAGRGDQVALIYDSPVTNSVERFTYNDLLDRVSRFAGVLRGLGVEKGDRVLVYMPMVPEAVVAMLAIARLGAIHTVVFGGFAAPELATRIDNAEPKVIVAASCGIEPGRIVEYKPLIDEAIRLSSHQPDHVVIRQRDMAPGELDQPEDQDWDALMADAEPADAVPVLATDPLYILYTSGTTGIPKGVVHSHGGYSVALKWSMKNVYGVEPGEVFWAASDVGWVVGHSYIVYAPLLHGATTVLFEGKPVGTPDPGAFWRVISEHNVSVLFTAPTAFRAIKRDDPEATFLAKYDMSGFRTLFLAGERADPATIKWAEEHLAVPVIDHWWQTETGWPIAANCMGLGQLPVKYGSPTKAVPGYDVRILGEDGQEVPRGDIGAISIKLPMPPGNLQTLWQNDEGFISSYMEAYPGYYQTGDAGYCDEEGYLYIMSRTDDIINVAGHRLSTGGMEEVLANHPDVAECAVIGVEDELKGQVPMGFVVPKAGVTSSEDEIIRGVIQMVRAEIGAIASFKDAVVVKRLPKTRSGKILRATMRSIADGKDYRVPATIEDPAILDEIKLALERLK